MKADLINVLTDLSERRSRAAPLDKYKEQRCAQHTLQQP